MLFEIPEAIHKNLIAFLGRVSLQGNEVPAFNEVIVALNKPVESPEKNREKE